MTIAEELRQANIDAELSQQILETLVQGKLGSGHSTACRDFEIPAIDGQDIVDFSAGLSYRVGPQRIQELLQQYPELHVSPLANHAGIELNEEQINDIGLLLSPYFAFGVLNGGSASSYFDSKKNRGFSPELFQLFQPEFESLACDFAALPKALCPAFLNTDGSYGPSFMGLKLRSLLYTIKKQKQLRSQYGLPETPLQSKFFQMTSALTHEPLQKYIADTWQNDPLQELVAELDWQPNKQISSEKQPLISTFDYSAQKWQFFRDKNGGFLPMPGGHGQCFFALRKRLQTLYEQGIRYISLGNIDNVAYNPHPSFIGLMALSGCESFFACSYRSSVDIKGGVLLRPKVEGTQVHGRLNCFDIGVGVDKEILTVCGKENLLFNCAIGYFDLAALLARMNTIIAELPLRVSEQNKDQGHYWQVEQITWEVIGLLDSVLIGAVRKEDHFLAAKLQLEAFVNTAYQLERYQSDSLQKLARRFAAGYTKVLQRDCDFTIP